MNDSSIENTPTADETPEERELRGRYVKGDFGKAGAQRGRHAEDEEGQYVEGDYGGAGAEAGLPTSEFTAAVTMRSRSWM